MSLVAHHCAATDGVTIMPPRSSSTLHDRCVVRGWSQRGLGVAVRMGTCPTRILAHHPHMTAASFDVLATLRAAAPPVTAATRLPVTRSYLLLRLHCRCATSDRCNPGGHRAFEERCLTLHCRCATSDRCNTYMGAVTRVTKASSIAAAPPVTAATLKNSASGRLPDARSLRFFSKLDFCSKKAVKKQ
jgi:hypothetical protein